MRQLELVATQAGKVRVKLVRELPFESQVEGCVADDETSMLYVGEEDVGVWREVAEPRVGPARSMLPAVPATPALTDDHEGTAIYKPDDGQGTPGASSQCNYRSALFHGEADNHSFGPAR